MNIDKRVKMCLLLDFYGSLLTEKQLQVARKYFEDDASLVEIADEFGISRQAVRDSLIVSEDSLLEFEEKLGLEKRHAELKDKLSEIIAEAEKNEANQTLVEKIKNLYHYL